MACFLTSFLIGQTISNVSPNSGDRGTWQLPITITGSGTNFANATSTVVTISQGTSTTLSLDVSNVNSVTATSLNCNVQIPNNAPLGNYTVSVYDQSVGGMISLPNSFTVFPNSQPAVLVGTTPEKAAVNQTLPITISVDHANFAQATDNVFYLAQQGTSTVLFPVPGSMIALNDSHLKASFDFSGYPVGAVFDVYCQNDFDGFFFDNGAVVLTAPTSISGSVIYAGNYNGLVELYQKNTNVTPNTYSLVASYPVTSNSYTFPNVAQASYYLRSVPINMTDVVATYYPSDISWLTSTLVTTNPLVPSTSIDITPVTSLSLPGGVTVNGNIGYGPSGFTKAQGSGIVLAPGIEVFLMDTDNSLYAQTTTDANGAYSFGGVALGNYKIVIDLPGYSQTSSYNFTVDGTFSEVSDLDFLIDNNEIFPANFMGLETKKLTSRLTVFPNPTNGELNIKLPEGMTNAKVLVYNHLGQMVTEQNISTQGSKLFTLNINDLSAGLYMIRLESDQSVSETRLMKQ